MYDFLIDLIPREAGDSLPAAAATGQQNGEQGETIDEDEGDDDEKEEREEEGKRRKGKARKRKAASAKTTAASITTARRKRQRQTESVEEEGSEESAPEQQFLSLDNLPDDTLESKQHQRIQVCLL